MRITLLYILFMNSMSIFSQSINNWKYNTVAHKLLQIEEMVDDSTTNNFEGKYQLIDSIIDACKNEIKSTDFSQVTHNKAQKILAKIDEILAKNNFFICVKLEKFSDALKQMRKAEIQCVYCNFFKEYREDYFIRAKYVHHIDCDLGSFMFLAVADEMKIPLSLVEVPGHNFVRWAFSDKTYLNWDVNTAEVYTDDIFRQGRTPTSSKSFTQDEEDSMGYLKSLSQDEVLGYYYFVIGRGLKAGKKYKIAREYYEKSILNRPNHPSAKHSLSYMIVFTGQFTDKEDLIIANRLATEALSYKTNDTEYIETLAFSYALLGNFSEAIKALNKIPRVDKDLLFEFENGRDGINVYRSKYDVYN